MKKLLITLMLFTCFNIYAQVESWTTTDEAPSFEQLKEFYQYASDFKRQELDSVFKDLEIDYKRMQIKELGGISFGSSKEIALPMLKNKYGNPEFSYDDNTIIFKNKKYAGEDFESMYFIFQSDGINSYLSSCIFAKSFKTKREAIEHQQHLVSILSQKYKMTTITGENGFETSGGGISPLWDGHWYTLGTEFYTGLHTDIIEYDKDLVEQIGVRYASRLIYGPFNYIKESF